MRFLIVLPTPSLHIEMVTYCTLYTNNRTWQIAYKYTGIKICYKTDNFAFLGRAQTNLAKLLLAKTLLLKHARTWFLLLKIWLALTNRTKSKTTFEHVLACATSKMLSAKSAKMLSKAFLLFARLMCTSRIFNKRKHVLAKAALLDCSAPGLRGIRWSSELYWLKKKWSPLQKS